MARQLKPSTIKSYSLSKLVNHAESYMYKNNKPLYRFDHVSGGYVKVYQLDTDNAYYYIGSYDKDDFTQEILPELYRA